MNIVEFSDYLKSKSERLEVVWNQNKFTMDFINVSLCPFKVVFFGEFNSPKQGCVITGKFEYILMTKISVIIALLLAVLRVIQVEVSLRGVCFFTSLSSGSA